MNENINLVDILKDAPLGIKLYSPVFGEITLAEVKENNEEIFCNINITFQGWKNVAVFNKYGQLLLSPITDRNPTEEVMLFPSKHHGTWKDFSPYWKHKHFEPGQKVLVPYYDGTICKWGLAFYSHYDESSNHHITSGGMNWPDEDVIAYKGNKSKLGEPVE